MLKHLGVSTDGPRQSFDYALQISLERQKALGYFVWTLAHLDELLCNHRVDEARLGVLRALAMVDQHPLDSHWTTAWPLLGCETEPGWVEWEKTSAVAHRKAHSASPLLSPAWVSTSIAKAKGEVWLRKNRYNPGGGNPQGGQQQQNNQQGGNGGAVRL